MSGEVAGEVKLRPTGQLALFADERRPRIGAVPVRQMCRTNDPPSSAVAAEQLTRSGEGRAQRGIALGLVNKFPGRTSAELAELGPLDRYQLARRLPELETDGSVRRGRRRLCRAHGTEATTWWPV